MLFLVIGKMQKANENTFIVKVSRNRFSVLGLRSMSSEWCLITILMFYPLFASVSILLGVPSRPLSVSYRIIYLILALLIFLIEFSRPAKNITASRYITFLILFWVVYLVRMYYDLVILGLKNGYASNGFMFYFQYGILGSFLPALAIGFIGNKINVSRLSTLLVKVAWVTAFCLFYIVYHEFGFGIDIFLNRLSLGDEANIIGPIAISQYGGLIMFISFYEMLSKRFKVVLLILWIFGLVLLMLGGSRGPLLSVVSVHVLASLFYFRKKIKKVSTWRNVGLVFLGLVAFVTLVIVPNFEQISLFSRIESSVSQGEGLDARSRAWSAAWNQFLSNPLFGDKIVENEFHFYPHNFLLEVLMSTGIMGGLFVFVLVFAFVLRFAKWQDPIGLMYFYLTLIVFGYVQFSLAIITIPQFWCLLMLCLSMNPSKKVL